MTGSAVLLGCHPGLLLLVFFLEQLLLVLLADFTRLSSRLAVKKNARPTSSVKKAQKVLMGKLGIIVERGRQNQ